MGQSIGGLKGSKPAVGGFLAFSKLLLSAILFNVFAGGGELAGAACGKGTGAFTGGWWRSGGVMDTAGEGPPSGGPGGGCVVSAGPPGGAASGMSASAVVKDVRGASETWTMPGAAAGRVVVGEAEPGRGPRCVITWLGEWRVVKAALISIGRSKLCRAA